MKRIQVIALIGGLLLLASGCAVSSPGGPEEAASSAEGGIAVAVQDPAGGGPQEGMSKARLTQSGFAVLDFRAIRDGYDRVSVIGEIRNIGKAARGVELQATLRNSDGRVLAVGHFYPASDRNIVPGEAWPFGYSFGRQMDAVVAELRIVGAFRTIDVLNVASIAP